jgi:hypothetical protein
LRSTGLADQQTSYAIGNAAPLFHGTWYWHILVSVESPGTPCCSSYWSPIHTIQVPDEPIRLDSFELDYFECLREVGLTFDYSDNSRDRFASWRLDFLKRKKKSRVAKRKGTVDESDSGGFFDSFKRPRKLRVGKRYFGRLSLKDRAGHVARADSERLRIERC